MDNRIYFGVLALVFGVQLLLCVRVGQVLVKLIPTLLILLLHGVCFCMYFAGGFSNWAWLILLLLLFGTLVTDGAAWAAYGIYQGVAGKRKR